MVSFTTRRPLPPEGTVTQFMEEWVGPRPVPELVLNREFSKHQPGIEPQACSLQSATLTTEGRDRISNDPRKFISHN
jgi:hypothetical protein